MRFPTSFQHLPPQARSLVSTSPGSILLETRRFSAEDHHSYLFLNPIQTLTAHSLDVLPSLFAAIESARASGHFLAGYLTYECGHHFEPAAGPAHSTSSHFPLAWFGVYDPPFIFDHAAQCWLHERIPPSLPATSLIPFTSPLPTPTLSISPDDYAAAILRIQQLIAAGDTYQVNFTDRISLPTTADPAALFTTLAQQNSTAYSALLHIPGGHHILSLSPELFFRINRDEGGSRIITRPMKGTMPRGLDSAEDSLAASRLAADPKNRAEHVMIVDLLRNDLGRICSPGSVRVEDIFTIERYETLLQMTSTIAGTLAACTPLYEIFRALFPSGSITGAPKIRTMQIIHELESSPRGIYTGAIGHIAPDGDAQFNVAIRTLHLHNDRLTMGVGGGIVADSTPAAEYNECLLKASFLTRTRPAFRLIETMLWAEDYFLLDLHLDRLGASAFYFDFTFDRAAVLAELRTLAVGFQHGRRIRVRLLLSRDGTLSLTHAPQPSKQKFSTARISPHRVNSSDVYLRHKTTHRALYDSEFAAAQAAGFDDVLFLNERGELTEGAISNLFLRRDGRLLTPSLTSGLLPGVYRRHMLETLPRAAEAVLTLDDLRAADAVFLCNSVRALHKLSTVPIHSPSF